MLFSRIIMTRIQPPGSGLHENVHPSADASAQPPASNVEPLWLFSELTVKCALADMEGR